MPPKSDEGTLVIGKYISAFVQSTGEVSPVFERKTRDLFEDELGELDPEAWYDADTVASLYEDVRDDVGPNTMKKGGEATGSALPFDESLSIAEALDNLNSENQAAFKNSDDEYPAGKYLFEKEGDRSARVGVSATYPYPKSFVAGLFAAFIERYGPSNANVQLEETEARDDERFMWDASW
jgi:hypothetical protein